MESVTEIHEDELLDALKEALQSPTAPGQEQDSTGAKTSAELRAATGWGEKRLRRSLRALLQSDRLETTMIYRTNLIGVRAPTPAYRLRPEGPGTEDLPDEARLESTLSLDPAGGSD